MSMIYIIASVSLTSISLALNMCPESISTVSIVNRCPANATEWVSAAMRKSCNDLGQLQTCTNADDFVYHCVLNKDATLLLEVCAPTHLMPGYCARFSDVEKRIFIDTGLDCTKFDPPCSASFLSNESYKYQMCYRIAGVNIKGCGVFQERTLHVTTAIVTSVIFAIIILLILITFGVGYKLKMIKFAVCGNQTDTPEKKELLHGNTNDVNSRPPQGSLQGNTDAEDSRAPQGAAQESNESNVHEDNQSCSEVNTMRYKSLSEEKEGTIVLEGVKTISDVRDYLAKKLDVVKGTLYVVDENTGTLWNDDKDVEGLLEPLTLMIALDENRMKQILHDHNPDDADDDSDCDNYDGWLMRGGSHIEMNCKHFKDADKWFRWTIIELLQKREANLHCPRCYSSLDVEEIAKACEMTTDEKIFFKMVHNLNGFNKNFVQICQRAELDDY